MKAIFPILFLILTLNSCKEIIVKPDENLKPSDLYERKQKLIRHELGVKRQIEFFNSNDRLDTSRIIIYNDKGEIKITKKRRISQPYDKIRNWDCFRNIYDSKTGKKIRTEYCNGEKLLKLDNGNYSVNKNGEIIVFAPKDSILWRIRNKFHEDELLYIHETILEYSKKPSFRNIMRLDEKYNIISATVFDPEPEKRKGFKEDYYTINHIYNSDGQRIKTIRFESDQRESIITRFEYFKNRLMKKEIHDSFSREFQYELKK